MKIEDGFNASPKAPAAARQSAVNTGLVVAAVSMALLTGVIGYMLGMQSSSSRSLAGSQGAAPGGSLQQGRARALPSAPATLIHVVRSIPASAARYDDQGIVGYAGQRRQVAGVIRSSLGRHCGVKRRPG